MIASWITRMRLPRPTGRTVLAVLLCAGVLQMHARGQNTIPAQLTDREFWDLFVSLSEPNGPFEDENYVSNELGYQRTMARLQGSVSPGGVFIGVGPEQNFHYVAAVRPSISFVVDIRRQNMLHICCTRR